MNQRKTTLLALLALILLVLGVCGYYLTAKQPVPETAQPVETKPVKSPVIEEPEEVREEPEKEETSGKQAFISLLLPLVQAENRRILEHRSRLHDVSTGLIALDELAEIDFNWLKAIAAKYNLDPARRSNTTFFAMLEGRIDIVPASLVIAQAAVETDWGKEPAAKQAKNYFSLKCFRKGCGHKAEEKPVLYYELQVFPSIAASVNEHMHLMNSHDGYDKFRDIRQSFREDGNKMSGFVLAEGLDEFHELGALHVEQVKQVIKQNSLEDLKDY